MVRHPRASRVANRVHADEKSSTGVAQPSTGVVRSPSEKRTLRHLLGPKELSTGIEEDWTQLSLGVVRYGFDPAMTPQICGAPVGASIVDAIYLSPRS